jgi:hypothetical protein
MPLWKNNNREESKPSWLNKIEKRLCVRTVRGWEKPLDGSFFSQGTTAANSVPVQMELLVTMPNDPSITGGINSAYAWRSVGALSLDSRGVTSATEVQYSPYFSTPFDGDSATSGGPAGTGVTHDNITYVVPTGATRGAGVGYQYGVDGYGVSTLGGLTGVTAYIKIVANDTNLTQNLTISLSGSYDGISLYTGVGLTAGAAAPAIPVAVYNAFFGATGDNPGIKTYRQDNIAVLVVGGQTAVGTKTVDLIVRDNSGVTFGNINGITGATAFAEFTMLFDRNAADAKWINSYSM